jgi:zinc transporter 9
LLKPHLISAPTAHHLHAKELSEGMNEVPGLANPGEAGHNHDEESSLEMHSWIGVALVLGFVFMLLVDQLSGGGHVHGGNGQYCIAFF